MQKVCENNALEPSGQNCCSRNEDTPARGASAPLVHPEEGVRVGPPMATRREFAAAAAATMAAALAARATAACASESDNDGEASADGDDTLPVDGEIQEGDGVVEGEEPETTTESEPESNIVTVDEDGNVHILNTFEDLIEEVDFDPVATYVLPVGCNVFVDCDLRAAVVQANPGARPLTVIGCLDFASGTYSTVLSEPVTGSNYAPSEARATEQLLVWTEVNNGTDDWALYAAPFNGQVVSVNTPGLVKLGEGNADWLPPQFAVEGNTVVWQVMPDPYGPYVQNYSHAYRWTLGATSGTMVYESPGRFACAPSISAGILTITPRVNPNQGVYYAVTALDLNHNLQLVDQHVMPVAVKPFFATRIRNTFAFSVEANYGYGGLLGNMGYYIGPGDGPFDYVSREPSAHVCYTNGYYIVKSQLAYFVIDLARQTYARIAAASGCVDYGDYPATQGEVSRFVTYAAVKDSSTGVPYGVLVRIFSLT